ncbi:hypothetical protein [Porphyromonas crevioricanis]|uniref:Uncharacterized protein n=2 Tax=Porphyromonas crevioricanis TaxID=393921 RepID=A0A2X4PJF6_9PORP|nr:hypothetical protein [Porphyromonas crevioricanis]GAD05712.1 hypothetical protein PORCRE_1419 [Porphyromonas crevioricanis JCM 15906]GAD06599.1 hypothetical protein PORCAN_197 [Porphyromonas crevioricanis JCM 13913]SJZ61412.1 hypothetical protein SAMN02745203_00313 [Porphyromonas crevioricanis]SQH72820.1 Uncharacterised protein [Porphyromonas crevioricanis]
MNGIVKILGIIVMLVGVLFLAVPYFMNTTSNVTLFAGLILVVLGFIAHIIINRIAGE